MCVCACVCVRLEHLPLSESAAQLTVISQRLSSMKHQKMNVDLYLFLETAGGFQ